MSDVDQHVISIHKHLQDCYQQLNSIIDTSDLVDSQLTLQVSEL